MVVSTPLPPPLRLPPPPPFQSCDYAIHMRSATRPSLDHLYILEALWGSRSSMFSEFYCCSRVLLLFPRFYIPGVLCPRSYMFPKLYIPGVLCPRSYMFPKLIFPEFSVPELHVPEALYSRSSLSPELHVLENLRVSPVEPSVWFWSCL